VTCGKAGKKMERDEVIQVLYRSMRDALQYKFHYITRKKNSLILETNTERFIVSFRMKKEKIEKSDDGW
jgi:hypothetical protein